MRPFLLIVTALIGLLHAYIGLRLLPEVPSATGQTLGWLVLAVSYISIPVGVVARSIRAHRAWNLLVWLGLLALGGFSSLLILTLARDLLLLLAWPFGAASALAAPTAAGVVVIALLVTAWGLFNARRVAQVVNVDVPLANLPAGLQGFTIVQISDIHVGPTIKHGYLDAIVERVNSLGADVVAITGDLVDGSVQELSRHTAPLARLTARHGSFFVTGNHEYYSNAPAWIAEIRRLGLRVLLNEHVVVTHQGAMLVVAGVTDYTAHHFDPAQRSDPQQALVGAPDTIKVLLAHQPRSAHAAADAGFDLQISGHTHGGQFWPWNLFVPLQQPFTAGLNRLRHLWVYTSRGTGYWGPPKRLGAPSEITRLRLIRA